MRCFKVNMDADVRERCVAENTMIIGDRLLEPTEMLPASKAFSGHRKRHFHTIRHPLPTAYGCSVISFSSPLLMNFDLAHYRTISGRGLGKLNHHRIFSR